MGSNVNGITANGDKASLYTPTLVLGKSLSQLKVEHLPLQSRFRTLRFEVRDLGFKYAARLIFADALTVSSDLWSRAHRFGGLLPERKARRYPYTQYVNEHPEENISTSSASRWIEGASRNLHGVKRWKDPKIITVKRDDFIKDNPTKVVVVSYILTVWAAVKAGRRRRPRGLVE